MTYPYRNPQRLLFETYIILQYLKGAIDSDMTGECALKCL